MASSDYARSGRAHPSSRQMAAFNTEHFAAWLMALTALALGTIGLLRGFGLIGTEATDLETVTGNGFTGSVSDGVLWMLPGIAAGLVAMALHQGGHHREITTTDDDSGGGMFAIEHALAYIAAAAAIGAGVLSLVVGFDVFDEGYTQGEGFLWGLSAILAGAVAVTLHTVGHHRSTGVIVTETRTTETTGPGGRTVRR